MTVSPGRIRSIGVAVATFERPNELVRLLRSLERQDWNGTLKVVVVDNDPQRSAQTVINTDLQLDISYFVEPEPGIAAARNRGVAELAGVDAIAFIDDDEIAPPHWLSELAAGMNEFESDLVTGPVIATYSQAPRWVERYAPHHSHRNNTGAKEKWPATNNLLIRRETLNLLGEQPFDNAFGLTGGSDADLAWRLRRLGKDAIWIDSAEVYEEIPLQRMRFKWWWNRSVKQGNVSARLMVRSRSPVIVASIGVLRLAYGSTYGVGALLFAPKTGLAKFANLPKGLGTLRALRGRYYVEYARPSE